MIKLDFTKTDGVNTLVDAIWLDEDHIYDDAEIEQMKQERLDSYIAVITAPQIDLVVDATAVAVDGVVI